MTTQSWKFLLPLVLLATGWFLIQEWRQPQADTGPARAVIRQPAAPEIPPKLEAAASKAPKLEIASDPAMVDPAQPNGVPSEAYVRGRMPDNLLSIRNSDILEFDRLVSPETAGMKVYMHKLLQQPRDEDWANATEEVLWQVTEQFYQAINSASDTKIEALHVECRTDLCYVDMPHDSYKRADKLRRGGDRKADMHIFSLVGKDGEPFAHQLAKNSVATKWQDLEVARWILAFDRGEATAALYTAPPPG